MVLNIDWGRYFTLLSLSLFCLGITIEGTECVDVFPVNLVARWSRWLTWFVFRAASFFLFFDFERRTVISRVSWLPLIIKMFSWHRAHILLKKHTCQRVVFSRYVIFKESIEISQVVLAYGRFGWSLVMRRNYSLDVGLGVYRDTKYGTLKDKLGEEAMALVNRGTLKHEIVVERRHVLAHFSII